MPKAASADPENWCLRCKEQEAAEDPSLPLKEHRHECFARLIAQGTQSNSDCYAAAGFKAKEKKRQIQSACDLKKRVEVQNRIRFLQKELIKASAETREWVDAKLKEIVDRSMQAKPHLGKDGRPDGQWVYDGANANKALFSMGKDRGMFIDKLQIIEDPLDGKSDAEVLEMVESSFVELGRPVCLQIMEKVFGLKYEGGGAGTSGVETPGESLQALH